MLTGNKGILWDNTPTLLIWLVTEHALSVICANIPSLRPLLTMFRSRYNTKIPPRPPPKAGLVTIGGSGGNHGGNRRHKSGKLAGWTTLMQ